MGALIAVVVVVGLLLAISQACDWIGGKTSYTLWAIVGTLLTGALIHGAIQAGKDSIPAPPSPVCKQIGNC